LADDAVWRIPVMTRHHEPHRLHRVGWLRAAVLGANDGIVSTASLIIGVAAAAATREAILVAGVAGLVAGAMSMAAGEYVSVSSQADAEAADLARETRELANDPPGEHAELAGIYRGRGLDTSTADAVATQLMAKDALGAHARDELGISDFSAARPVQAALASAAAFSVGASLPLAMAVVVPVEQLVITTAIASLVFLALLGAIGARAGGASLGKPVLRVTFWGAMAMVLTAGIGRLVGGVVA
jgi:VIT1/CCC1 family predicted Fe2+/Mn2+ transporter